MSNDEKTELINLVLAYHCDGQHHLQFLLNQILINFLDEEEYQQFLERWSEGGKYSNWEIGICP